MGIWNWLNTWVTQRQERAPLWQLFHRQPHLARLARINLQKVLQRRGQVADEAFWRMAQAAAEDRTLTLGAFLDRRALQPQKAAGRKRAR